MSNNNSQSTSRSERIRTVYDNVVPYNCFYCLKTFDRSTKRSSHVRNTKRCREMAKAAAAFDRDIDMDMSMEDFVDIDQEMDDHEHVDSFDVSGATVYEATHMDKNTFCYMEIIGLLLNDYAIEEKASQRYQRKITRVINTVIRDLRENKSGTQGFVPQID
ncbi:hypothetical protein BDB01DRAFT_856115, partial [Pilobolus umbonatus]